MKLVPGMAFRCMEPPRHIYLPLFDPQTGSDDMLLVNLTTLRESCVDDTCILYPQDYPGHHRGLLPGTNRSEKCLCNLHH